MKGKTASILYLDFPDGEDNHLRKLAGIRRYALTRDWQVQTITREEIDRAAVKALCAGDGGRAKPIGCIVEALADIRSILPPSLFGDVPVVYLDPSRPLPWRGVAVVSCDNAAVAAAAYGELSAGKPQCYAAALVSRFDGSRRLFELRFREAMGHSVLDEILHVRLEKAQALLTRREVPVSRIAALCGFRTDIELRKLFRLRFKTSMRQWRKDHAPDGEA